MRAFFLEFCMNPWTSFWQQGHSTTFGPFFSGGYEGAVKNWWLKTLESQNTTADLLDIGCGNGALVIPTLGVLKSGSYCGIDLADVKLSAPAAKLAQANPNFSAKLLSKVPAESLPFDDNSFDLASSIYGVEYSNMDQATREIYRVLRVNGQFHALMHSTESVITEMTARALREYKDEDMAKILESLNTIDGELNRLKSPVGLKSSLDAEAARERLNALAHKHMSNLDPKTGNAIMVQFVGDSLKYFKILKQSQEVRADYLNGLQREFAASRERYTAMAQAAKSTEEIYAVVESLKTIGFKTAAAERFYSDLEQKELAAWQVCATK